MYCSTVCSGTYFKIQSHQAVLQQGILQKRAVSHITFSVRPYGNTTVVLKLHIYCSLPMKQESIILKFV